MNLSLITLALTLAAAPALARAQSTPAVPAVPSVPPSVMLDPAPSSDRVLLPQPARDPRDAVLRAGTLVFLTSYGLSVGMAANSLDRDDRGLYVPVAGPWIALAAREPCGVGGECERDTTSKVLLVSDGVVQALGAIAIVGALATPRPRETLQHVQTRPKVRVRPVTLGRGNPGVVVAGSF